jgi:hypothetical protein
LHSIQSNKYTIDLSDLSNGLYLIEIRLRDPVSRHKILLEHGY